MVKNGISQNASLSIQPQSLIKLLEKKKKNVTRGNSLNYENHMISICELAYCQFNTLFRSFSCFHEKNIFVNLVYLNFNYCRLLWLFSNTIAQNIYKNYKYSKNK